MGCCWWPTQRLGTKTSRIGSPGFCLFVCLLIPIGSSESSHIPLWARITCWWFVSCKHLAVFTPQEIAEMNHIWWEIFRVGWFSYPEELACLLFTLDIQNHPVLLSEECTYNIYLYIHLHKLSLLHIFYLYTYSYIHWVPQLDKTSRVLKTQHSGITFGRIYFLWVGAGFLPTACTRNPEGHIDCKKGKMLRV